MKSYRGILFDWDGCLVNTLPIWLEGYKISFAHFGLYPSIEEISTKAFGDWHSAKKFGITDEQSFLNILTGYVYQHFVTAPLTPGASMIIDSLKHFGIKLGLVTSSERVVISQALKFHSFENVFDTVVTGNDVLHHKPHAEPIILALKQLSLDPAVAIMVGDSSSDIIAATSAGIDSCLYKPSDYAQIYSYQFVREHPPTFEIKAFDQLITRFRRES